MRLLIVTQAVDRADPILGFFHRWIEEFSSRCESVLVICLREGVHSLPKNVTVFSLGKERGASRWQYLKVFYSLIWSRRTEYDAVLVHMNPEYVVLGGPLWRLQGKRVGLWYVHRARPFALRVANAMVNTVFTSARQSIGLWSRKTVVVGHGIDVAAYVAHPLKTIDTLHPHLVCVGRITPIKHLEIAVGAVALLRKHGLEATLDLIGSPVYEKDKAYEAQLYALIQKHDLLSHVVFRGSVSNERMPSTYVRYDISLNSCPTGGIDKAVLESMAAGVPVFVSNTAFREYLDDLAGDLIFHFKDAEDLARHIEDFLNRNDTHTVQERLRALAREHADVSRIVPAIINSLYGTGH